MDYGQVLSRTWSIIWENKFLILLGVLVALGSGGGGGGNTGFSAGNGDFDFQPPDDFEFRPPDLLEDFGIPALAVGVIIMIAAFAVTIGLAFWVLSTISRGGLIAGASTVDAGGVSSFGQAFQAGWQKGWTLLGIGILPAIPGFILVVLGVIGAVSYFGVTRISTGNVPNPPMNAAAGIMILALVCVLVPIALALSLLRTFANRACMLEDLGVFAAYKRGTSVLFDNIGPALVLFLIQIAINIGLGIAMIVPGIVMALCCLLWPVLLLIQGTITAYFSTLWTLAWREWTGLSGSGVAVVEANASAI